MKEGSTGEGREIEITQRLGRELLVRATVCFRHATMHELAHPALQDSSAKLLELVNGALLDGHRLELQSVGDSIFLSREAIRLDMQARDTARTLRQLFQRLGIHEVSFESELTARELGEFLQGLQRHIRSPDPATFADFRHPKIQVRAIARGVEAAGGIEIDERQNVLRTYALLALVAEQALQSLSAGREPPLGRLRRALQELSDASHNHDALLVGLTRGPVYAGETHRHLAATAALVLLMGRKLGLTRSALVEVGMAAVLHHVGRDDPGKSEVLGHADPASTDRSTSLAMLAAGAAANNPRRTALKSMLRIVTGRVSQEMISRAAVAYEMLLPVRGAGMTPGAIARLVTIPCTFDLLTSPKPPRVGILPDQGVRILLDKSGERFDERLVRLFVSTVGLYPVGSVVKLNSGETGIVVEVPGDPANFAKPRVKVIRNAAGAAVDVMIDLAKPGQKRAIASTVDAVQEDVNVPQFLLA